MVQKGIEIFFKFPKSLCGILLLTYWSCTSVLRYLTVAAYFEQVYNIDMEIHLKDFGITSSSKETMEAMLLNLPIILFSIGWYSSIINFHFELNFLKYCFKFQFEIICWLANTMPIARQHHLRSQRMKIKLRIFYQMKKIIIIFKSYKNKDNQYISIQVQNSTDLELYIKNKFSKCLNLK